MWAATRTTTGLLEGLFDPAAEAVWQEFDRRYRPIIVGLARKLGLPDQDAADVAQETLARFVKAYRAGEYDRTRGRLRSWIIGIARYRIADALRTRAERRGWRGDSLIGSVPEPAELDGLWDVERRQAILRQAVDELRDDSRMSGKTIRAFEMLTFHRRTPAAVAEELGMTLNDVYQAKNRVAGRLREIAARLEALYDED
ncbi:MAG: sigma-70 family RNA polymerase sigma factor [Planctomycetota bacterium]|nr:sigma-70 family RNA polymerase sigma factor [Planctomycetota bacterium]